MPKDGTAPNAQESSVWPLSQSLDDKILLPDFKGHDADTSAENVFEGFVDVSTLPRYATTARGVVILSKPHLILVEKYDGRNGPRLRMPRISIQDSMVLDGKEYRHDIEGCSAIALYEMLNKKSLRESKMDKKDPFTVLDFLWYNPWASREEGDRHQSMDKLHYGVRLNKKMSFPNEEYPTYMEKSVLPVMRKLSIGEREAIGAIYYQAALKGIVPMELAVKVFDQSFPEHYHSHSNWHRMPAIPILDPSSIDSRKIRTINTLASSD